MEHELRQNTAEYQKRRQRKKLWQRAVGILGCIVVFCTTYALILPAITLEKEPVCGLTEHQHDDTCYSQPEAQTVPICTPENLEIHGHTDACYDDAGQLICGYADFAVHTHDESCYNEDGTLWCTLPEVHTHTHTDSCYSTPESTPAHTHTDECYAAQQGELICTLEEGPEHQHTDECYAAQQGELICTLEEGPEHQHTDECYAWEQVLVCPLSTEAVEAPEPELICDKEEVILHEHTANCYDGDGKLICGKLQVQAHQHDSSCFMTQSAGEPELICGLEEHTHSEACYDSDLTEEDLARVEEVIALIDALPTSEEARAQLDACDRANDPQGYNSCLEALQAQVSEAQAAYDALTEAQQAQVTNAEKLEELEWLLREPAAETVLPLSDDSAYVSELTVTGTETAGNDTDSAAGTMSVRSGDTLTFRFLVRTASYTEASFREGRVHLEFVLPLAEDQASFELSSMTWLDHSEGYEPVLSTETRTIDGSEVMCQVLTGWALLSAETEGESAIPGEFAGTVPVTVLDMAEGEGVALQISAAMEYNTWEGMCEAHQAGEKLTVATGTYTVTAGYTAEEQQAAYEQFLAEVEALEALEELDDQSRAEAEDLLERLEEAYQQGQLTQAGYTELYERTYTLLYGDTDTIAEAAVGTNWILLRDSGWFEEYSDSAESTTYAQRRAAGAAVSALADDGGDTSAPPSDVQVEDRGGTNASADGSVSVSKTISGTDLENVFDITLQVQTSMNVSEISAEPDMAVVIVMDISNTMNSNFGGVTRYAAAMTAAEQFLDQFAAQNSLGISKVGYVAFNTDAHQIFGLQACSTQQEADALKNTMRTQTGNIINASGYQDMHTRFTNVEAGLAMAADMLNGVSNENKFIIFLSDGFPTTYISSGYSGYDPYDSTGRFYDHVLNKPCLYGTSYSDEAAIRARNKAAAIKNSGTTIFSIGVDVAGQTIQTYITQSENAKGFSVVDRTGTNYEIGDASSTEAYKTWLRDSIGSGYYYDSTDSDGLFSAYHQIFETIKEQVQAGSVADWVAEDPMPTVNGSTETVEFIGFYNKAPELVFTDLTGTHAAGGENTAQFNGENSTINWDLKQSGYQTSTSGGTTTYTYTLVYRVRLKNENGSFTEGTIYPTNDTTTLQYRTIEGTDGNLTVSDPKTVGFPIPSVQGYLAELTFQKVDPGGSSVAGAEFTLSHDIDQCSVCRGDGSSVAIADMTAVSGEGGTVTFQNIPSGHKYTLEETKIPDGYLSNGSTYAVEVAYDNITVTVTGPDGNTGEWNGTIVNQSYYELPNTGGAGTGLYFAGGLLLTTAAVVLLMYHHTRRRKEDSASP